ncbi:MAG: hypothetical protein AB8B67_02950 [Rickettsiaceae bacterium]
MSKILKLLALTVLLAFATNKVMADTIASDGDAEIKFNGHFHFQAGWRHQNHLTPKEKFMTANNKDFALFSSAALNLQATFNADNGISYGALLSFKPTAFHNTSGSYNGSNIFVNSDFGKMQFGSQEAAGSVMRISFLSITAATGDDWTRYFETKSDHMNYNGVPTAFPNTGYFFENTIKSYLSDASLDKAEGTRKISLFTGYKGLSIGVSYIPDSSNVGSYKHSANSSGIETIEFGPNENKGNAEFNKNVKNAFSVGLSYNHAINDSLDATIAATSDFGNSVGSVKVTSDQNQLTGTYKLSNLFYYDVGAMLDIKGLSFVDGTFSLAGSYGTFGKSLTAKEINDNVNRKSWYYTAAIAYQQGPIKTSLSWYEGHKFENQINALVLGTQIQLFPGWSSYIEVSDVRAKRGSSYNLSDPNNLKLQRAPKATTKANILLLGTKLKI